MSLSNTESALSTDAQDALLHVAAESIRHGLEHGRPLAVDPAAYGRELQDKGASFVTLHIGGALRGCIGTLEAHRPLSVDVAHNAFAAAFSDPRFAPLSHAEFKHLSTHISVLNPAQPMHFASEADLISQLRPGIDGLILQEGRRRGTFLPAVWESLSEPRDFLRHLKMKAGLPSDHWSDTIEMYRYTTQSFPQD